MDLNKTGSFIAELRKQKNLTQVQLASKLNVSEKTISKWECGKGFPDTSIMLPLCNELGVTANELLSGKKLKDDEYKLKAEENIVELTRQNNLKNRFLLTIEWILGYFSVFILLVSAILASYLNIAEGWRIVITIVGLVHCIVGVAFCMKIEKDAGYYECAHCKHKYIPTNKQIIWSMHMGRTRYMTCPHCHKKSWQKKKVEKD